MLPRRRILAVSATTSPLPQETQAWRALIALCIGFFMILLDQTIVAVATPQFQQELAASLNQVVWVSSIYLLCFAVPLLITGRLGDRYGQRNVYLVGMAIFTVSSLACGLAPNIETLIIARAIQGIGAAILTPQTMSVINRIFARNRRGAALGLWGVVAGLASLTGPILGGFLVGTVGWSWIFLINVPLGVICLVLVWLWVPTLETMASSIDLLSVVVWIFALGGIIFAIQQGPEIGWQPWIWAMLIAGLVLVVLFIWLQRQAAHRNVEPVVPLALFKIKNFSLGSLSITAMGFAVAGLSLPIMFYLQKGHDFSAEKAGFMLMPMAVLSGVLAPWVGRMSDRINPRVLSQIGFSFMLIAVVSLAVVMRDGIAVAWMIVPIVLLGLGNAFVWSPNSAATLRDLSHHYIGAASGVYKTTRQVGSVLGTAIVGAGMQIGMVHTSLATAMGNSVIVVAVVLAVGLAAVSRFERVVEVRESSHQ